MNSFIYILLFVGIMLCLLSRYWYILSKNLKIYSLSRPHKKRTYLMSKVLHLRHQILLTLGMLLIIIGLIYLITK